MSSDPASDRDFEKEYERTLRQFFGIFTDLDGPEVKYQAERAVFADHLQRLPRTDQALWASVLGRLLQDPELQESELRRNRVRELHDWIKERFLTEIGP